MLGDLTIQEIDSLLLQQMVGRIGFYTDDKIFVVPITYVYKEGYIYGHSHEGQKIDMMRTYPKVCFEVDTMDGLNNWQSAIVWGEFEEMDTTDDKMNVFKTLTDRIAAREASENMMRPTYSLPNPHPHNAGVEAIAFRIKAMEKTGRFEKKY